MSSTLSFTSPLFSFPPVHLPFSPFLKFNLLSSDHPLSPQCLGSIWLKTGKNGSNPEEKLFFFFSFAYFNAKTLLISLFFNSSDLGFESGFLLVFWTLNPDLRIRIFFRIRIQEAIMLRIHRIRIRITASPLSRPPVPLLFFSLPQFTFLLLPSHILLPSPHILLSLPSPLPNTSYSFPVSQSALFPPPPNTLRSFSRWK